MSLSSLCSNRNIFTSIFVLSTARKHEVKKAVQNPSETNTIQEQGEDKDYLYINVWLFLSVIGALGALVMNVFYQVFDIDTFFMLGLIVSFLMGGSMLCVLFAMKKGARQTRILGLFSFFLTLLSVTIGMVAVYDNKKTIVVFSLLLTALVSLCSMLPLFYYGDYRELDPLVTDKK
jgi:hypothetical protein